MYSVFQIQVISCPNQITHNLEIELTPWTVFPLPQFTYALPFFSLQLGKKISIREMIYLNWSLKVIWNCSTSLLHHVYRIHAFTEISELLLFLTLLGGGGGAAITSLISSSLGWKTMGRENQYTQSPGRALPTGEYPLPVYMPAFYIKLDQQQWSHQSW